MATPRSSLEPKGIDFYNSMKGGQETFYKNSAKSSEEGAPWTTDGESWEQWGPQSNRADESWPTPADASTKMTPRRKSPSAKAKPVKAPPPPPPPPPLEGGGPWLPPSEAGGPSSSAQLAMLLSLTNLNSFSLSL